MTQLLLPKEHLRPLSLVPPLIEVISCIHLQAGFSTVSPHTSKGYSAPAVTGMFLHRVAANRDVIAPECAASTM
jgi:hypothetical protein